jgi:hypothetical protein
MRISSAPWEYRACSRLCLVQSFAMPFAHLLGRSSQPTPAHSRPIGAGSSISDDSNIPRHQISELMTTIRRPWKTKKPSSTPANHSSPSQLTHTPALVSNAKSPTTERGVDEAIPAVPSVLLTNVAFVPSPEIVPVIDSVSDKLVDAWDAVKVDPKSASTSRRFDTIGVTSTSLFFSHDAC